MPYTRLVLALGMIVVLAVGVSCRAKAKKTIDVPEGATLLRGAGATFPAPLYEKWFAEYRRGHKDVFVHYDAVGSGEGVKRFIGLDKSLAADELVDFGGSDAAMSDSDIRRVERGVQLVPLTAGAVVLAYNLPGYQGDLKLSREALAGICLGEITKWNDQRIRKANDDAELPNLSIRMVVRLDGSGTTFALTNHLSAISDEWRNRFGPTKLADWPGGAMRVAGNEAVAARIMQSVGGIGYVQHGFARRLGLKTALLENKAGKFVAATPESTTAALADADLPENLRLFFSDPAGEKSYPIVTFSWVLLYKDYGDAKKAALLRRVFEWCLTEGQAYSENLGYIPLPANVVSASAAAVRGIGP